MKEREHDNRGNLYFILCILATIVTLFPLACSYIMDGGIIAEWIVRVKEIAEGMGDGSIHLFSSLEAQKAAGITVNAMNSDLWFVFPGFLYLVSGNMVFAYRAYMLLIQIGTFLAAVLCFQRISGQKRMGLFACMGVMLYMTNPYRIYVCYDAANLSQATAWMLLPLYVWAVYGAFSSGESLWDFVIAALALAGMGYADLLFFLSAAGITILAEIIQRKITPCTAVVAGSLLFFPGLLRLGRYLFTEEFAEWEIPLQKIMEKGYHVGQFFTSYVFRDGKPGMGLGMMICLLLALWLKVIYRDAGADKSKRCFVYIGLFFTVISLTCFPWDILQRLGGWAVKLISLIGTPAVFWGMAIAAFCIPAAESLERFLQYENRFAANILIVVVVLFSVGICVYQCNMLTFSRLPLDVEIWLGLAPTFS